ncbi:hypothetical protein RJT34_25554 [Clitoria ternatea]|uniref:Uncharacterized protein n=1 Tax=Clitoria ternatea TaxID=43366 RepID=A0AAN9FQ58_CLITE
MVSLLTWLVCVTVTAEEAKSSLPRTAKSGEGCHLISIEDTPDGAIVGVLQVKHKNNVYGPDIPFLRLYVKHETENRLRLHMTDAKKQMWEVPYNLLPREQPPTLKQNIKKKTLTRLVSEYSSSELVFSHTSDPFSFVVKRKSNGDTLFDSSSSPLVFKEQYLEISTKLPKDASLYAINLNADLYGSHPVYMDLRNEGGKSYAHGVLLLNNNRMDVFYRENSLTYKVIGGLFDFYFFSGPSPLSVLNQYTSFISRPAPMLY